MGIRFTPALHKLLAMGLCWLIITNTALAQTNVLVNYTSGSQQTYTVTATGKLYFDGDNLVVVTSSTDAASNISTSQIQKLTFTSSTLPLQLLSFAVRNEKTQVSLLWSTASEFNTSHFLVERSTNGTGYQSIGQVAAVSTVAGSNYSFTDAAPKSGISYYRLKQIDKDGKYVYSKILSVSRTAAGSLLLAPNPASSYLIISSATPEKLAVKIYAATGQLMMTGSYSPGEQIAIDKLTQGVYLAVINDQAYRFIKE